MAFQDNWVCLSSDKHSLNRLTTVFSTLSTSSEYVAIKILNLNATASNLYDKTFEAVTLKKIKKANPSHRGFKHCIALRDTFVEESHHGPHICLVTDPYGSDLGSLTNQQRSRTFPVPLVKRIATQMLLALEYVHDECDTVYIGLSPAFEPFLLIQALP